MELKNMLLELSQEKILEKYNKYSPLKKEEFKKAFFSLDFEEMKRQRTSFLSQKNSKNVIENNNKGSEIRKPICDVDHYQADYITEGEQILREGSVGIILLAGGMGSRLQYNHPKGMYPISAVKNKTMFQLLIEKLIYAGKKYETDIYVSIMTSTENNEETVKYFRDNNFFGMDPNQIDFFIQKQLPFLDENGNFYLDEEGMVLTGPDGNGEVFENFRNTYILNKYLDIGIKHLSIIPIDNPLADPLNSVFIGFHHLKKSAVSLIVLKEENGSEKMGVIAEENSRLKVIEYTEISDEEKKNYCYLNTGLFLVSLDFIIKNKFEMPFHYVQKSIKKSLKHEEKAWKSEKFIFDILDYCGGQDSLFPANTISFSRNSCYGPLKNLSGNNTKKHVQEALYQRDRKIISDITKKEPSNDIFELSMEFHYPTDKIKEKWKGKVISKSSYLES